MQHATLQAYWVTVELARGRTADRRIMARSAWAAGWLWRELHPDQTVVMVRPAR
jgi:hypothetical protein